MKFFLRWMVLVSCLFVLQSCAFTPKKVVDRSQSCKLSTPKLTLEANKMDIPNKCVDRLCLVTLGVVVPASSFVLSGSIVVAGNVVRWVEYQGSCEESVLRQMITTVQSKSKGLIKK